MGAVVGIDLGTTNTVVAAMRGDGPVAIRDESGSTLIPSIVSFLPSGAVLVGNAAKERRTEDTKNTVYSVKRLIGRPWDSPEVRQARSRFSFDLREGPGRATFVVARGETFTLPEISAYVLRKAKSIAEIELGESVDRAVVTVPANFNDLQRAATKVAGRVAGLEVLRILNEPTAAALAYGYNHGAAEKIAVFDFGGGTFDITLLSLTESVFEVLATAGNTFLGGDDLDWAIAEKMADEFSAQHGRDIHKHPSALEHLRAAAETIKIRLSEAVETEVKLDLTLDPGEKSLPLSFAMTRAEFERLTSPIVDRAFDVCREALGMARVGIDDFDHVLLVGGTTRIPFVRHRIEEYFKRGIDAHLDPHEVVALGAALQAHALTASRTSASRREIPAAPLAAANQLETTANTEWRQKTQPFGRLGSTNIGVGQSPDIPSNIQVPAPDESHTHPIPTTKHLGSRGRLNTSVGIGPPSDGAAASSRGAIDDELDPEDWLPVVAGTAADAHAESDEDEETAIFPQPALDADSNLPMAMADFKSIASDTNQGDDVTVRVRRSKSGEAMPEDEAHDRNEASLPTLPDVPSDPDLPAVAAAAAESYAKGRTSAAPSAPGSRRPSKAPSTDELRQRYGDLPLIIGGKRLGTRPSENPDHAELPAARPPLDTIVDSSPITSNADESLPAVRAPASLPKTIADSSIHAELPLVGVQAKEQHDPGYRAPAPQRPRNLPPARSPARPAPAPPKTTSDSPYSLSDSDLVEEPRNQPSSTARISIRPAVRSEPIAEASLPIPNLPERNATGLASTAPYAPGASNAGPAPPPADTRHSAAASPASGRTEAANAPRLGGDASQIAPLAATLPLAGLAGPDFGHGHAASPIQQHYGVGVPLLIDVTPLSLCVETVGSYSDVLIDRNTPVPCERTREFVTVQDGQQVVRVRVAQGESRLFAENLLLGELELTGLRPAPRGQLRISVTFGLDSDGILHVRAIDLDTGRAATSELRLAGIPSPSEISQMTSRHLATS
jgi:molecular chaperone DnaK (HSP70)